MRIAVVLPLDPEVRGSGLAHRSRFWVRALASLGELTTIVLPIAGPAPASPNPSQLVIECEQLDHPWLPGLAQHAPEYLGARWANELEPFDLIVGHRSYVGPFCIGLRGGSDATLIIDLDDDDAAYFAAIGEQDDATRFAQLVDWLHSRANLCVAASEMPGTVVVPNSVPLPAIDARPAADETKPNHILMVGNFTYAPNIEGAQWFEQQVLPKIAATHPDVALTLAGPGSSDVSPAGSGFVDDLRALYRAVDVAVVPILSGSGSRIKALEAWAHAVPVVGTSLGMAGLTADGAALVADQPAQFAQAVVSLLENRENAAALGAAGRVHVENHFSEELVAAKTAGLVSSIVDGSYRGHVAPVGDLDVTEVEDGLVVYEQSLDTAHRLNSTASIVFTLVDRARSVTGIAHDVAELFGDQGVDQDVVSQTIDDLVHKRLLSRLER